MDTSDSPIPETGGSSRASPFTRAARRDRSPSQPDPSAPTHESSTDRWTQTRESEQHEPPSEAPTPAPDSADTPASSYFVNPPSSSSSSRPSTGTGSGSATPALKSSNNVDTEDEDVRIAIMALGAMKNLDGKSTDDGIGKGRGRLEEVGGTTSASRFSSIERRDRHDSHTSFAGPSSGISTSSVTSTAISSPSSTPATEFTQASISTPSGSGASSQFATNQGFSASGLRPLPAGTTLADLPPDFEFPAIIQDEDGNEVEVDKEMLENADFLNRVSHLPIVRGTIRAYELGKQRSKIVKYGGDLVESSVKAISRPVVGRLGASLGERGKEQLDDFACRQLDRLYPSATGITSKEERQQLMAELDERERTEWAHMDAEERSKRRRAYWALRMEEKEREAVVSELRQRKGSRSGENDAKKGGTPLPSGHMTLHYSDDTSTRATPPSSSDSVLTRRDGSMATPSANSHKKSTPSAQMSSTIVENAAKTGASSGWSSMLVEAGATAGGLSAAMSEESMKSLKYCLQWLQYATAHIEHQITVLRDLIVRLNHGELELTSPAAQNLTQIKGDVVNTIRSVVDVVGKYAGGALPEPARVSVKAFILSLPARWATVNRAPAVSNGGTGSSQFGGSPASPSFSAAHLSGGPHTDRTTPTDRSGHMSAAATAQAANRVLTLAVESLDILRSVTVVVGESLDRADIWVERLRMIGIQRKRQHDRDSISGPSADGRQIEGGPDAEPGSSGWESARGLSSHQRSQRRTSIGAGSDMSMGTSASTKRRRRMRSSHRVGGGMEDEEYSASGVKSPLAPPHSQLKSTGPILTGSGGSTAIATSPHQMSGANTSGVFNIGSRGSTETSFGGTTERRRRGKGGAATPTFAPTPMR
ncbi:unnamed protein product [Sympodiomycopsis kandeliae]